MRGFELHHRPGYRHLVGQGRPRRGGRHGKNDGKSRICLYLSGGRRDRDRRGSVFGRLFLAAAETGVGPARTRRPAGDIGCVGQRQPAASGRGGPPLHPHFQLAGQPGGRRSENRSRPDRRRRAVRADRLAFRLQDLPAGHAVLDQVSSSGAPGTRLQGVHEHRIPRLPPDRPVGGQHLGRLPLLSARPAHR